MLRFIRRIALAGIMLAGAVITFHALTTREESLLARLYELTIGPPDLGPADFARIIRRTSGNDALACPVEHCGSARADFVPPVFAVGEERLRDAFTRSALGDADVIPVFRDDRAGVLAQDRYVQRTRLMRYPDTIDVRFIPLTETTSTLAIYSRSQLGLSDFGVNLARITRWSDPARLNLPVVGR
jgi:Protein of unknown function (DUF1499)